MDYQINGIAISGETLKDAIEGNFDRIAKHLRIGNVAGYQLQKVWCEYDDTAKAAVLHIVATGSDMRVEYDPDKDPAKEYTAQIPCAESECPQRIDFELEERETLFDPFNDACLTSPSAQYGALLAIINEIGRHHCKAKSESVTAAVSQKGFSAITFPRKHVELCRRELARLRPKTDNETAKMMERVSELAEKIMDHPKEDFNSETIFRCRAEKFFRENNKMTALAKIRVEKGITQDQLAEAAQMSKRQLQNYEKCPGSTLWSASKYVPKRLADALGVKVSDIVDHDGFPVLVEK